MKGNNVNVEFRFKPEGQGSALNAAFVQIGTHKVEVYGENQVVLVDGAKWTGADVSSRGFKVYKDGEFVKISGTGVTYVVSFEKFGTLNFGADISTDFEGKIDGLAGKFDGSNAKPNVQSFKLTNSSFSQQYNAPEWNGNCQSIRKQFSKKARKAARKVCKSQGVKRKDLRDCVFDVLESGHKRAAEATKDAEKMKKETH